MRLFIVAVLSPVLLVAQQTGRVEGRVVSALDGAGVPRASVRLTGTATGPNRTSTVYLETTSSDGRFSVDALPPGSYQAAASRVGFMTPGAGQPSQQRPVVVNVVAGQTTKAEIPLVPLASLSGVITDESGDAIPGAMVRLMRPAFQLGRMQLLPTTSVTTDDRGQFRLANVQPGRYYLNVAFPPNFGLAGIISPGSTEVRGASALYADLPTYYPGSPDIRSAKVVEVQSANIENLRMRMLRGRTYSIKGTVVGPTLAANGPRPSVNLQPRNGDVSGQQAFAALRPDGTFEIGGVAPGDYTVVARLNEPGNPPKVTLGRAEVTVTNRDLDNVAVRMADNVELTGKLTIEGVADLNSYFAGMNAGRGGTPPNLPAGVQQPSRLGSMMLIQTENLGVSTPQIQIQDDGTFKAQNIPPLSHLLMINTLPPGTYLKTVRLNRQDISDGRLELSSAGSSPVLELVLSTKPAALNFKAPPGIDPMPQPAPGVAFTPPPPTHMIVVWPLKPALSASGGVLNTFLSGNNSLRNLPPGDYFAAMWEETPPQDLMRIPEFLARFNSVAARVTLKEGETSTVEPKVISKDASKKVVAEFP